MNDEPKTPADILDTALRKEKSAYNFYDRMAMQTRVAMVRELLEKLREEEAKHVRMIEKKIAQLFLGKG